MKKRLPRKIKKKMKKAIEIINRHKKVLYKSFEEEFVWGFSAIHVDKKTGEIKNVPMHKAYELLNKQ